MLIDSPNRAKRIVGVEIVFILIDYLFYSLNIFYIIKMKKMSLNTIHKKIWEDLEEGISNSKSGFHFPVISTIDKNGHPSSRTVVLRKIEKKK